MEYTEVSSERIKDAINCSDFYAKLLEMKENEKSQFDDRLNELKSEANWRLKLAIDDYKSYFFDKCSSDDRDNVEEQIKKIPKPYDKEDRDRLLRKIKHSSDSNKINLDGAELYKLDLFLDEDIYQFFEANRQRTFAIADPNHINSFSFSDEDIKTLSDKEKKYFLEFILAVIFAAVFAFFTFNPK